jgi:hypothetical protein
MHTSGLNFSQLLVGTASTSGNPSQFGDSPRCLGGATGWCARSCEGDTIDSMTATQHQDVELPNLTSRRRRLVMPGVLIGLLAVIVIGFFYIDHYQPLEIGGQTGARLIKSDGQIEYGLSGISNLLSEPPGSFTVEYGVTVGSVGDFPVTLTGISGAPEHFPIALTSKALLSPPGTIGGTPFKATTIAKGKWVSITLEVRMTCIPLTKDAIIGLPNPVLTYQFVGLSHTATIPVLSPVELKGPQNC